MDFFDDEIDVTEDFDVRLLSKMSAFRVLNYNSIITYQTLDSKESDINPTSIPDVSHITPNQSVLFNNEGEENLNDEEEKAANLANHELCPDVLICDDNMFSLVAL